MTDSTILLRHTALPGAVLCVGLRSFACFCAPVLPSLLPNRRHHGHTLPLQGGQDGHDEEATRDHHVGCGREGENLGPFHEGRGLLRRRL